MKGITFAAGLLLACSAFAGGNETKKNSGPAYDRSTETKFTGKIAEIRETPKDQALGGIHITVTGKDMDIYVGPTDFVKIFGADLKVGEEVEVLASKVKFDGNEILLAREIRMGHVTLILRDDTGWPNWDWNKPTIPTGL